MKTFTQRMIDPFDALVIVRGAVEKAVSLGIDVNAAVVDASGNLVAFLRTPRAAVPSADIAIDKAYSAAGFRVDTRTLGDVVSGMSDAVRQGLPLRPRLTFYGGGVPIVDAEGEVVGAVGVSGGSEDQDIACAQAGISAVS